MKYPPKLREKAVKTNLKLRNPKHRKRKITLDRVIFETFAKGLIEKDIENRKIEASIKLAKGEIEKDEAKKVFRLG